ncbi:MAG: carboxypeptidase regulatory-like domain-containing protein, partial [Planctomycetes bacterium]|nr:carboxypeptidase regulatory-like domain-containing protein [Planctomycetota bacterium]
GNYAFSGLLSGDYYVRTLNTLGYGDELYLGQSCNPFCDIANGTAIALGADEVFPAVDFDLTLTPTISGSVSLPAGGPAGGVPVKAYDLLGAEVASTVTDVSGEFTLRNLYDGSFYVVTANNSGYVDALWQDFECGAGCDPTAGTPIPITGISPGTGIDLVLGSASAITGTVTETAAGAIAGVTVEVYLDTGVFVRSVLTNGSGGYRVDGLTAGEFHVVTRNEFGYIDEGAGGEVCKSGCQPTSTAPVTVGLNEEVTRDFALDKGGVISGQVRDSALNGLQSVTVRAFNEEGALVGSSTTGPAGNYSITGLAGGDVYLRTSNNLGYRNQRFDGLDCDALCDVLSSNPVPVAVGSQQSGVDFTLGLGGSIAGVVTGDGSPLSGVQVQAFDSVGLLAGFAVTSATGSYQIGGLDDGEYRLKTVNSSGFVDVVRGGDSCSPEPCSITSGVETTVASSNELGVDFALARGSALSGVATDNQGIPLPNGTATVFSATGQEIKTGGVFNGSFFINGLADGTYYLLITNGSGLVDQLFDGLPCPGGSCDVTGGTPIVLGTPPAALQAISVEPASGDKRIMAEDGTNRLTFTLDRGTVLSGSVKDESNNPVRFIDVYFFDSEGDVAGQATTDGLGNFKSKSSFPVGTYYAATSAPGEGGAGNGLV